MATNNKWKILQEYKISTHATHKGGDSNKDKTVLVRKIFQLTPPIRVATTIKVHEDGTIEFQLTPPIRAATKAL